jgi:hypothetical protein
MSFYDDLTLEQLEEVKEIFDGMMDLITLARPDYSVDDRINFWHRYFFHPGAGDMEEELKSLSREHDVVY